ncbi:bifunctional diaminohydroxyphosphoribosylaminopyrimidine deaminase/5-amino-6-(5-phosphoribosylamino)uracil reductase RibD [Natronospira sp. AB-CW4]|uniref:Riboflavin biosynthesis protein RibD n=2 Tax=Natronospira bacteriovora TaxID=3069753 RepID=A0ABU0W3L1_9GAMM|nr:bifunctional diaminohydroxyphosphoribosylaminopyrimidine deaminase/5-amino-6-(5-phosphoribosylamino)uracil reductase RibD [Natronospira sp. AB-CW4]MDQ2068549.1 bifunctional diaminohydroxyphosphoribosylaminopyrimidine deaminase/5-amino-6-(5-phosphoribosylamino)uracil reductase RibD [Natronospira sp. AB-CW4]
MRRALSLAARGRFSTDPNPRVGCVIVRDGEVVGEGWHERPGEAHAEVHALAAAGDRARGATAYVTLEPCAHQGRTGPCCVALAEAGVARVIAAMDDSNPLVNGGGLAYLREQGIVVASGLLAGEARALNRGFVSRMQRGRPWVTVKLAASLDGRTAMASGESRWISGEAARLDVHRQRAAASVVMSGIGTVLADDPKLNARLPGLERQPGRVILDSQLRTPPTAALLQLESPVLLVAAEHAPADRAAALEGAGAEILHLPGERPDPATVLSWLARERDCNEVLVEAGPVLAGSLLQAGLVDEICLYLAPHLMGDAARGLFSLPGLEHMQDRLGLRLLDVRQLGEDLRLRLAPIAQQGE